MSEAGRGSFQEMSEIDTDHYAASAQARAKSNLDSGTRQMSSASFSSAAVVETRKKSLLNAGPDTPAPDSAAGVYT
jgi:hypothetical protein